MSMSFCPHCESILIPRKENGKIILRCEYCGLNQEILYAKDLVEKTKLKKSPERGTGSVKEEDIYATYKHVCKKCGYEKAEIIDVGVLISDEDELFLLKCGKCGFTERVGRRTS